MELFAHQEGGEKVREKKMRRNWNHINTFFHVFETIIFFFVDRAPYLHLLL